MEDQNIYYNINIVNNAKESSAPKIAKYYEERLQPFITNPKEYEMKIVKFSIPASEIPILVMEMKLNDAPFHNRSVYRIGFNRLGVVKTVYVDYVSEEINRQPSVLPGQSLTSLTYRTNPYYWIYSYQHFISLVNDALIDAMGQYPLAQREEVPYLLYDSTTQLISLVASKSFTMDIVMNTEMQNFFQGFDFNFFGNDRVDGDDYYLKYLAIDDTSYYRPGVAPFPPAVATYDKIDQNYNSMIYWFSLSNIFFTTSTLPIIDEYLSTGQESGNKSSPILTEFTPDLSSTSTPRSILNYYDNGASRWISFTNAPDIRKLELSVYWQDKFGVINPITIPIHQSVSIKILFRKKLKYRNGSMSK
jgi:hypothetical protein